MPPGSGFPAGGEGIVPWLEFSWGPAWENLLGEEGGKAPVPSVPSQLPVVLPLHSLLLCLEP